MFQAPLNLYFFIGWICSSSHRHSNLRGVKRSEAKRSEMNYPKSLIGPDFRSQSYPTIQLKMFPPGRGGEGWLRPWRDSGQLSKLLCVVSTRAITGVETDARTNYENANSI